MAHHHHARAGLLWLGGHASTPDRKLAYHVGVRHTTRTQYASPAPIGLEGEPRVTAGRMDERDLLDANRESVGVLRSDGSSYLDTTEICGLFRHHGREIQQRAYFRACALP